ncbi:MAG TPA: M28 family peptidase [Actinomycetota bacterium]|nr:M28 family peptidase [Actinomycetota bacterium]
MSVVVVATLLAACAETTSHDDRFGTSQPESITDRSPSPETMQAEEFRPLGSFQRWRAMAHVRKLAGDIGVRVRARRGERLGARYIARELERLGYRVHVQRFAVDGDTSRNVVAWWPEARRYPIVVGAHMDSVPSSPGANDNASGVAVLLETARLARATRQAGFLKFVAFGAEEYGQDGRHHVGSQVFVHRLGPKGRRKLGGMISVDMIADGRPLIVGNSGIGEDVLARYVYRLLARTDIGIEYRTLCDCSDNGPFEHAGIPASFMWSGDEPNYHDDSDTVANMSPRDLERTGKALRAFVRSVDQALLDRLRRY